MIGALFLTLALSLQGLGEPRTSFEPLEGTARVGTLVRYVVEVETAGGVTFEGEPAFGYAVEVVDTDDVSEELVNGAKRDRFTWTLRVLGGGSIEMPELTLTGAEGTAPITVPSAVLEVPNALAEDEDTPRPLPAFPEPADRGVGDPRTALLVLFALLALPLAVYGFVRSRRRTPAAPAGTVPRTPRERLADIDPESDPRAALGALAPLVRAIVDEARRADAASATDEEWATDLRADGAVDASTRDALAAVVLESSTVRYGGGDPTVFAAREAKARAEELVDRVRAAGEAEA